MPVVPVEYAVPRNPAVPSPAFGDVITSEPVRSDRSGFPRSGRVRVYDDGKTTPTPSTLIGRGPLLGFERGWIFLAASQDAAWRDTLREIDEVGSKRAAGAALRLAMDVAVSASGLAGKAFRTVTVENFVGEMTAPDLLRSQIEALAKRAQSGNALVLPCVDIVRVRSERGLSWIPLRRIDRTILTLETGGGDTRAVCVVGSGAPLAATCMQLRFEQEFLHLAGAAWTELLGLHELWQSLVDRYGDLSSVAVGRVWDDWKNAVRARMASRQVTPAQVVSLALHRMGPSLDHYRKIPPVLARLQAAEAVSRVAGA